MQISGAAMAIADCFEGSLDRASLTKMGITHSANETDLNPTRRGFVSTRDRIGGSKPQEKRNNSTLKNICLLRDKLCTGDIKCEDHDRDHPKPRLLVLVVEAGTLWSHWLVRRMSAILQNGIPCAARGGPSCHTISTREPKVTAVQRFGWMGRNAEAR